MALAADHVVSDTAAFVSACRIGAGAALQGGSPRSVCGRHDRRPNTDTSGPKRARRNVFAVEAFVEKPD